MYSWRTGRAYVRQVCLHTDWDFCVGRGHVSGCVCLRSAVFAAAAATSGRSVQATYSAWESYPAQQKRDREGAHPARASAGLGEVRRCGGRKRVVSAGTVLMLVCSGRPPGTERCAIREGCQGVHSTHVRRLQDSHNGRARLLGTSHFSEHNCSTTYAI